MTPPPTFTRERFVSCRVERIGTTHRSSVTLPPPQSAAVHMTFLLCRCKYKNHRLQLYIRHLLSAGVHMTPLFVALHMTTPGRSAAVHMTHPVWSCTYNTP